MSDTHTLDLSVHPVQSTLKMLASLLERITKANDKIKKALPEPEAPAEMTSSQLQIHTSFTRFHARSIPSISINAYLTRILKYCPCANECFLSLLVYFDRMARNVEEITGGEGRQFSIDSFNIHRLIIAGIMVSAKYFSDVFFTNSRYAKVGGLPVSELNQLEVEFLTLNNFSLAISIEELQTYGDQLMKHWTLEEAANKEHDDDCQAPSIPPTITPPPSGSNVRQEHHLDSKQTGGQTQGHSERPVDRHDASRQPYRQDARRDPRQGQDHPIDHRQGPPHHSQQQQRQEYRPSHGSEPRQDYRRDPRQQEHVRDHRSEHHQHYQHSQHPSHPSQGQQQQYYKNGGSHHNPQQQHSNYGHSHRQGNGYNDSDVDRNYGPEKGRYHASQNAPITPTEMTTTSRLSAPSPIH